MDLTDQQWTVLERVFRPRRRPDGRGWPLTDRRGVLNAVLWVLRTGAPWVDLPPRYPPYTKRVTVACSGGSGRGDLTACCIAPRRTSATGATVISGGRFRDRRIRPRHNSGELTVSTRR